MGRGVRVWWVDDPAQLVPDHEEVIAWGDWPTYWEYPWVPSEGVGTGYAGMCCWAQTTDDHKHWLIVTTYKASPPQHLLAHETAHLARPDLDHFTQEFDNLVAYLEGTGTKCLTYVRRLVMRFHGSGPRTGRTVFVTAP